MKKKKLNFTISKCKLNLTRNSIALLTLLGNNHATFEIIIRVELYFLKPNNILKNYKFIELFTFKYNLHK